VFSWKIGHRLLWYSTNRLPKLPVPMSIRARQTCAPWIFNSFYSPFIRWVHQQSDVQNLSKQNWSKDLPIKCVQCAPQQKVALQDRYSADVMAVTSYVIIFQFILIKELPASRQQQHSSISFSFYYYIKKTVLGGSSKCTIQPINHDTSNSKLSFIFYKWE